ncbi:MAG: hypothetical protein OSB65_11775, partial [Roseibacillus sp.]|nr:hypothetical protein [Roseibacillus sp.]
TEPSVKVFDAKNGEQTHAFEHVPPVESVAFSNDGSHLAAGNLMGDVRIWELATSKEVARISTPNFTGWGIIKGHYYTGGIYSLAFSPDDSEIFLAGMGTTRDPAAGNGKQLWERWNWREGDPQKKRQRPRRRNRTRPHGVPRHPSRRPNFRDGGKTLQGRLERGHL